MSSYKTLANLSASIRNAQESRKLEALLKNTKLSQNILEVLKKEGFIRGFTLKKDYIHINLKYFSDLPTIQKIEPILKGHPDRYLSLKDLYQHQKSILKKNKGLETFILSTPKGILSDYESLEKKVGGKILLKIL